MNWNYMGFKYAEWILSAQAVEQWRTEAGTKISRPGVPIVWPVGKK
jgi:hypothetical protein